MTCHVPYQRARGFVQQCLGVSCSPKRIRQDLDRTARQIRQVRTKAVGKVVYQDATKVKAGPKQRGAPIHVAITAEPDGQRWGRNQMRKRLCFLRVAPASNIKVSLRSLKAKGIVHDGEMNLSGCAKGVQRGLWHLVHQLKHYLWLDGISSRQNVPYVKELIGVLYDSKTPGTLHTRYRQFTEKLKAENLINSFTHLKGAQGELSVSRKHHFDYHTTAPVEREMREINRRADIGARWSIPGIENLLLVKTWCRLNQPKE